MNRIIAKDGHWLTNGEVFAKEVSTFGDASMWVEITDAEKVEREAAISAHGEEPIVEKSVEERLTELENKYAEPYNHIGKLIQTKDGDGTWQNPYKTWKVGTEVNAGEWWETEDGYLWEAIADGVPTSSTDRAFWDVVGLD